jgi:hypothetical protein
MLKGLCIELNYSLVVFDGVMVIVLAIGSKVRGFKTGLARWIKVYSTTYFEGEEKPLAPCRKLLRHVKGS